jgi:hypothetical protein
MINQAILYWQIIDLAEFDKLENVLSKDAQIMLPNTNEIFVDVKSFISFNKEYPGRWYAKIFDIEKTDNKVITITKVWTKESKLSFFVTSVFKFEDSKISEIKEYWSENSDPPEWRIGKNYTKQIDIHNK